MLLRLIASFLLVAGLLAAPSHAQSLDYPETKSVDTVDVYHGTFVHDPYRWLEDATSDATRAWVEKQNALTERYLAQSDARGVLTQRLTELWNFPRYETPIQRGGRIFFGRNTGLQNQPVEYVLDATDPSALASADAGARVLIDPNALSDDGTVALNTYEPSPDGAHVVYGVSEGGSDWQTLRVRNVDTGTDRDEVIRWNKFSGVAWTADGSGFYYGRFPAPDTSATHQARTDGMMLYYHRLGTPQSEDRLVYERPDDPRMSFRPEVTGDGRYLVVRGWRGSARGNALFVADLQAADDPAAVELTPLIDDFDAKHEFVGGDGSTIYVQTDRDAPNQRLVAVDVTRPEPENWTTVIPESDAVLDEVKRAGDAFAVHALVDVKSRLTIHALDGERLHTVDFPTIGSVAEMETANDGGVYFTFTSFTYPESIYHVDAATGATTPLHTPSVAGFDADRYTVEQVFYTSDDSTRIPMFVVHRTGLERDGANPTFLYGYGGFDVSLTPRFSPRVLAWLEMGGVYAVPNLRGGGEYGEAWHEAGKLGNKQTVFDDFAYAARYLIDEGYTSTPKLAIGGGSNGGLLVGASITQRPHLFGAAVPAVGVLDMLRYQEFTIGWAWTSEYGSSENPEQFEYLYAYSPLHNVVPGVAYPPTFITTADTDDRVVPAHSYKFAAALQKAQGGDAPILLRVETDAGHGAGKPTSKQIEEAADVWTFLVRELDVTVPDAFTSSRVDAPAGGR